MNKQSSLRNKLSKIDPLVDVVRHTQSFNIRPFLEIDESFKRTFSLRQNRYIALKWNKFLDNQGEGPKVILYRDLAEKCSVKEDHRKMQLNGDFYDKLNKIAPVPVTKVLKDQGASEYTKRILESGSKADLTARRGAINKIK